MNSFALQIVSHNGLRRITDKLPVCFDGPSLRQGKAKEKLALYKELTGR